MRPCSSWRARRANAREPELAGVVVGPDDGAPAVACRSARDIGKVRLNAELVTLSACDTGHGRLFAREGILGLARSFLEAGANSVLASLWPVDDDTTRALMHEFYRSWQAGRDHAAALARARRAVRHRIDEHLFPTRAHPFFWASFVLIDHRPRRVMAG